MSLPALIPSGGIPVPAGCQGGWFELITNVSGGTEDPDFSLPVISAVLMPYIPSQARFTAEPQGGTAPLTVNFTDQSTGNVTSYLWSFGYGKMSSGQNPSHTYENPGAYTVTLHIFNGSASSDSETMTDYIIVDSSP